MSRARADGASPRTGRVRARKSVASRVVVALMLASAAMFSRVARAVSMPAAVTAAVKGDLAWFDDAALAYDEEELRAMLDRQESDHGYGALATAVMRGDEATAKKVLSMGADARSEDHEGHTPMSMAAVSGKLNMVKLLREHGVDAGARGRDGFTALQRATWGETEAHAEVVRYLVRECGMDVDETDAMGVSATFRAVDRENAFMLKILLELGADPNFANKRGDSLLATAVRKQNAELVSILLEANADVTKEDSKGRNLRKLAKQLRSKKVLNLISEAYASAMGSAAEL